MKSAKQFVIATCTIEFEFVACFKDTTRRLWQQNFISRLEIVDSIANPLKIYCDNVAVIFLFKNDKYSNSVKHIE